jgi:cold shock CspA family protein
MSKATSFNKKEIEKRKEHKRKEKTKKKEERKTTTGSKSFDDMIAYVDENGMITNTQPDANIKKTEIDVDQILISAPKREDMVPSVQNGRVEYFNVEKGYGFIKDLGSINKYFFHISNAPNAIKMGDLVSFELEKGHKGNNAINIAFNK